MNFVTIVARSILLFTIIAAPSLAAPEAANPTNQLSIAEEKFRAGDLDGAVQLLETLLKSSDSDAPLKDRAKDLAALALQARGEKQFRQGRIAESIADFDRQIELQPAQEAHHWQRGIAYYYAREYEKGA